MSRIERNSNWNLFKYKIKHFWVIFYMQVISPFLTLLGNGIEKLDNWFSDNRAKSQYMKALYDVDPTARIQRDIKQVKFLLIVIMICVIIMEMVMIF